MQLFQPSDPHVTRNERIPCVRFRRGVSIPCQSVEGVVLSSLLRGWGRGVRVRRVGGGLPLMHMMFTKVVAR